MRLVIQRCTQASVTVDDHVVSSIGAGLMVLVGIGAEDTEATVEKGMKQILKGRLWPDEVTGKPWQKTVVAMSYEILLVSQFTLLATLARGARPDFRCAMRAPESQRLFDHALSWLRQQYSPERVQSGLFGKLMHVSLTNDGPVTVVIDSARTEESETPEALVEFFE